MNWKWPARTDDSVLALSALVSLGLGFFLSALTITLNSAFKITFAACFAASWSFATFSLALLFGSLLKRAQWPQGARLYAVVLIANILLLGVQALALSENLDANASFLLASAALFAFLMGSTRILSRILGKTDEASLLAVVGAAAAILTFHDYKRLDYIGLEHAGVMLARDYSVLLVLHPLFFTLQQFVKALQDPDGQTRPTSLFTLSPSGLKSYGLFLLATLAQICLLQAFLGYAFEGGSWLGTRVMWLGVSFQLIPPFVWALQLWRLRPIHAQEIPTENQQWIGMKTAVLLIDHDPHEESRLHLPALLYRARQLQCEQILQRTFSRSILTQSSAGSQISLALDPRRSFSPCIESLLIMSMLYIDGLTLVERRLRILVNLLPYLDPEIARQLDTNELESLFSRLQGFFHLDYCWVDQAMESGNSVLNIRLEHLNVRQRQRVLMQLSNSQWLGNFIWISEAAREQIRLESPFLLSAIDRLPIKIEQVTGKTVEAAVYLMKFENLIPRLQHYYNFEEVRALLSPIPMAVDTVHFVQQLEAGLLGANNYNHYHRLLTQIREYEWIGFQAKDTALDLVMRTMKMMERDEESQRMKNLDATTLKILAREAIQVIGYPSQDFHLEHLNKIELRQILELQRICLDRTQPRFEEAWLTLASLPSPAMDIELARKIHEIVRAACASLDLRTHPLVIAKSVETYFSVARVLPEIFENEIKQTLELLSSLILNEDASPQVLVGFLDKKVSLEQAKGKTFPFSSETYARWERHIAELEEEKAKGAAETLVARWHTFEDKPDTSPIAS